MSGTKNLLARNAELMANVRAQREGTGAPASDSGRSTAPVTAIGELAVFRGHVSELESRAAAAEAALAESLQRTHAQIAALDQLHELPGRRRQLSDEQYDELRENLRANPLAHPITVRVRPAGGYEVIAGHNRLSAYRDLGRTEIAISVLNIDDDEAERIAFYSNLLSPSLSDYEKYLGFRARMKARGLTQVEVAAESGVSQALVSFLMAFGDLPPPVLEVIGAAPGRFGSSLVPRMVKLAKAGKEKEVLDAARRIANGESTQQAAIAELESADRPAPTQPEPIIFRTGRKKYCELVRRDKTVRLSFSDAAEAEKIMEAIQQLLKERS